MILAAEGHESRLVLVIPGSNRAIFVSLEPIPLFSQDTMLVMTFINWLMAFLILPDPCMDGAGTYRQGHCGLRSEDIILFGSQRVNLGLRGLSGLLKHKEVYLN